MKKLFASFHLLQHWGLGMTTIVIRPFHSSVRFLHWKTNLRSKIDYPVLYRQHWHPNITQSQCSNKMSAHLHPCSDEGLSPAICISLPSLQFPAPIILPSLLYIRICVYIYFFLQQCLRRTIFLLSQRTFQWPVLKRSICFSGKLFNNLKRIFCGMENLNEC